MRTCTIDGCNRKHVAKGLCSGHYNRTRYTSEQRHPKRPTSCAGCGKEVLKRHSGERYRPVCSDECRYLVTFGRTKDEAEQAKREAKALVGPLPRVRTVEAELTIVPTIGRPFICVPCEWCGESFIQDPRVTGATMRYCTRRCARAKSKNLRKAREHGASGSFTLAEVVRLWLAFDKCCAYCQQPTDGLPDPDHVNPLSRGGSNSITNILPACRMCNADKNDMTLTEWAADRAMRGKAPRVTSWTPFDPRVKHLVLSAPTRISPIARPAA